MPLAFSQTVGLISFHTQDQEIQTTENQDRFLPLSENFRKPKRRKAKK